jgi:OFA family oxalate/formate antiporter-like MFS transporter
VKAGEERVFYGWCVVAVAFLTNFMSTGTGFYIFNALMTPLCDQRGWTRTEMNAAPAIGLAVGILSSLLYGTLVTRVGPRILMFLGSIVSGIAFASLGFVSTIAHFYLLCMLLYMGNSAMSGIVSNTAVSNWFVEKRGRALGLATAGISLSGAILPFLAMRILDRTDLRSVFLYTGLMAWTLAPVIWLVVRDWPEEWGMVPDGSSLEPGTHREEPLADERKATRFPNPALVRSPGLRREVLWKPGKVVRTRAFWLVGFAYALVLMGTVGVMFQLGPRFTDIGYDRGTAMALVSLTALIATFGKTAWGALCDRYEPRRVVAVLMAMNGIGLCLALVPDSALALCAFILLFGFAMVGIMSTLPILVADLYGRESFASVSRFMSLFIVLEVGGYLLMGQSFDRTGSYDRAYAVFVLLDLVAAGLVFAASRPPTPGAAEPTPGIS